VRTWRTAVADWLHIERGLRLKHPEARVLSCAAHLDALGMRITRDVARPLPRSATRFRQQIRAADHGRRMKPKVLRSLVATSVSHLLG
jgi:hypothetical protein